MGARHLRVVRNHQIRELRPANPERAARIYDSFRTRELAVAHLDNEPRLRHADVLPACSRLARSAAFFAHSSQNGLSVWSTADGFEPMITVGQPDAMVPPWDVGSPFRAASLPSIMTDASPFVILAPQSSASVTRATG